MSDVGRCASCGCLVTPKPGLRHRIRHALERLARVIDPAFYKVVIERPVRVEDE